MYRAGVFLLVLCELGCAPETPEQVGPSWSAEVSPPTPDPPWVRPECLASADPKDLTLGLLFETQQDLSFNIDGGSRISTYSVQTSGAPGGSVQLTSGYGTDEHVEGVTALCAQVAGIGGFQIDARVRSADGSRVAVNLADFQDVYVEFELRTDQPVRLKLEWGLDPVHPSHADLSTGRYLVEPSRFSGDWQTVRVPFCAFNGVDLSHMFALFGLYLDPIQRTADGAQFCVDAVRWLRAGRCPFNCGN